MLREVRLPFGFSRLRFFSLARWSRQMKQNGTEMSFIFLSG